MPDYAMTRTVDLPYEDALERVTAALKQEGFGVLTEIDVKETLKKKLDVDFRKYKILGACNPPLAKRALEAELEIGTMLPCNVCVWEEGERAVVSAFNPMEAFPAEAAPALGELAREVSDRLRRVLDRL